MARLRFKGAIGAARISRGTRPSVGRFTRSTRASLEGVNKRLNALLDRYVDLGEGAVRYGVQTIFNRSQQLVPVDTGKLKASGYISTRRGSDGKVWGYVGYARGGDPFYAVFVHERLDLQHKPPTQAKFLQRAMEERMNRVARRINDYLAGRVVSRD